jgi:hypothetical protein
VNDPVKEAGETVREALGSWSRTARLSCLLIAAAVAAVIYVRFK